MSKHFQQLMQHLWEHLGLVLPHEGENEAYIINVDGKTDISIFASPKTHLNIIAKLGLITGADKNSVLETLLRLNCFTPIHPTVNFKIGLNPTTKGIELWIRKPLHDLSSQTLLDLFSLSVEMSEFVRNNISQKNDSKRNRPTLPGLRSNNTAGR